jgi:BirA family transcriptional regulator, biotin operon repressor / biotin---[acetyl-CoA-carboxylase] ligase
LSTSASEAGDWPDWPAGVGRTILDQVDSTNAHGARIANDLNGPEWIMATRQTQGRGRRGRDWVDPAGNFAATLVMRPDEAPEALALRSFVAALALYDALVAATGRVETFSLKWPNDVLAGGGKLAGILLESPGDGLLLIGIGVNLRHAPDAGTVEPRAHRPTSLLDETGATVTGPELLALLAPAYARHEAQFTTYGFAPIRAAWLARAARLGQAITARIGGHETTGTFETVDAVGNLVLSTAKGRQAIPAAEVFF